jgi:hypothetical protein
MLFRFAVVSEAVAREYANLAYQQPYQWAMYKAEVRWRPPLGPAEHNKQVWP